MATAKKSVREPAPKKRVAKAPRKSAAKSVHARLRSYRDKRDFRTTAEPTGGTREANSTPRTRGGAQRQFVVQKHDASHLHYDFRLELDGVLLSWSVPKGPTLIAGERRLAVRTEDHPMAYADFEGVIPKGEYGGGTVIVWDRGSWSPQGDARAAMAKGHLDFALEGEKLRGRFHLVKTKGPGSGARSPREHWLLMKAHDSDERTDEIVDERPESVLSGHTVEEVAAQPTRVWHSRKKAVRARSESNRQSDVLALVQKFSFGFPLTNLDKLLFPDEKLRKAELIAYYACLAGTMLPYLGKRPLTVVRCPNGSTGTCFFQKHAYEGVPDVVLRVPIREGAQVEQYMAVDDARGVVAMGQLGALELHTWGCHIDDIERPDQLVFDLDPDETLHWDSVVAAARDVKRRLADLSLRSFVKTTGGKGLHVTVPLARKLTWDQHKAFAEAFVVRMVADSPDRYVSTARKAARKGKIFLDYLRNGRGATFVAPYSPRARKGAAVATPVTWEELDAGIDPKSFTLRSVVARLESSKRDPWHDFLGTKQSITQAALKELQ